MCIISPENIADLFFTHFKLCIAYTQAHMHCTAIHLIKTHTSAYFTQLNYHGCLHVCLAKSSNTLFAFSGETNRFAGYEFQNDLYGK